MKKQTIILHAIPNGVGFGAFPFPQVIEVTELSHEDKQRVQKELEETGYFVQTWFPQDAVPVLVSAEVRERVRKEQEADRGKP